MKQMAQQGFQQQATRHNDQAAPHRELVVCLGLSAAVVGFQRDVAVKATVCWQCILTLLIPIEGTIAILGSSTILKCTCSPLNIVFLI